MLLLGHIYPASALPPTYISAASVLSSLAPTPSVAPPSQPERPSLYGIKSVVAGQGGAQVQFLGGPSLSQDESSLYLFFKKQKMSQCLRSRCGRQLWSYHLFLLSQKGFMVSAPTPALPSLTLPPVSSRESWLSSFLNCVCLNILHFGGLLISADLPLFPFRQLYTQLSCSQAAVRAFK